ncbi:MAG TPA: prolyl oligopeptidase family serine peptidase, partial [Polyangiaceae bacterium]|nr:prolyl oligopeptidase family serine peptidase [Polyangiaceae bacterium]
DSWRLDGKGPNKPHGIQDFIACAEYLVREKYTSTSRLAASGGSGGGILIGRAVTERPDLFAAASIYAGVVNAMRILEASNGANQKDEMGSPDNEAGAHALYAMDVFYNVRAGVKYPPLMLGAGLNDERVSPWMTAKLGAQILANGGQVWLRVEGDDGHGFASTRRQRFDLFADAWSFFLQQMGDPAFK